MLQIIMPIHNTDFADFKKACFSVLSQTKKTLLFVVDDASENNNSILYENFCKKMNIAYHRLGNNVGPGNARQYGIDNGYNTEWIGFLDADDVLLPHYCEILTKEATLNNADIVIGKILHEDNSRINDFEIPKERSLTWLHGKIYKKDFLIKNKIRFHENLFYNEDVFFNLYASRCSNKIIYIDKLVYIWRNNKNSVTRQDGVKNFCKKHNIEYFKANLLVLKEILNRQLKDNLGIIISQIYNSYQEEIIYGKDIELLDKIIVDILYDIDKESYLKYKIDDDFIDAVISITKQGNFNILYKQSFYEWIKHFSLILDIEEVFNCLTEELS